MANIENYLLLYTNWQLGEIQHNTAIAALPDSVREEMFWNNVEGNLRIQIGNQLWSEEKRKLKAEPRYLPQLIASGIIITLIMFLVSFSIGFFTGVAWIIVVGYVVARHSSQMENQRQKWLDNGGGAEVVRLAAEQVMAARTSMKMQKIMHEEMAKEAVNRMKSNG